MADKKRRLFADANFPISITNALRRYHGDDVLTVQQFQGTSEPERGLGDDTVLDIAIVHKRAVVTLNGGDFRRLHFATGGNHKGIIICNQTFHYRKRAKEIDEIIKSNEPLDGKLLYVPPIKNQE